jgi:uncharacterized protein YycO
MKIIFTHAYTIGGALIRFVDGGYWSHCGIITEDGMNVTHATMQKGVIRQSLTKLQLDFPNHTIIDVPVEDEDAAQAWLLQQVGKPYDFGALLGFVFDRGPDWSDDDKWYCSEMALMALLLAGAEIRVAQGDSTFGVEQMFREAIRLAGLEDKGE